MTVSSSMSVKPRFVDGCSGKRFITCPWPRPCGREDRKSTRLNSSHANISYAVFCLKKKNTTNITKIVTQIIVIIIKRLYSVVSQRFFFKYDGPTLNLHFSLHDALPIYDG